MPVDFLINQVDVFNPENGPSILKAAEVIKASPLINASTFRNWYEAYIQYCTVKKGGFGLCDTCGSTMVNGFVFLLF